MQKIKGFVTHLIQKGDTLQRIAMTYKLDNWQEIALLNSLEYPFIDDSLNLTQEEIEERHERHLLVIGDSLLVPSDYEVIPEVINRTNLEVQAYGSDLDIISRWYQDSIINLETMGELDDNTEGDLKLIQGIANLKQAITMRLMTNKGDLVLHPDYGSDINKLIGKKKTVRVLTKLRLEIEKQIRSDFRVKDVSNISVVSINNGVTVDCVITPIDPYTSFRYTQDLTNLTV